MVWKPGAGSAVGLAVRFSLSRGSVVGASVGEAQPNRRNAISGIPQSRPDTRNRANQEIGDPGRALSSYDAELNFAIFLLVRFRCARSFEFSKRGRGGERA